MTIYLLILLTLAILLLACACEHNGVLRHANSKAGRGLHRARGQVRLYKRWKERLEEDAERKQQAINEWRLAANVLREDNLALASEAAYLRARRRIILMAYWRRRQKRTSYPAWVVMGRVP